MKALKKLLAMLLALLLMFAMAACSGKDDEKSGTGNTYKTPIELLEKYMNAKTFDDYKEAEVALFNGLCEKAVKKFYENDSESSFNWMIQDYEDEFGRNYEFLYEIKDKEEIDEDYLENFATIFRDKVASAKSTLSALDSDDYIKIADAMEIYKSDAEELVDAALDICDELADLEITEGYELTVEETCHGSKLNEPETQMHNLDVYKVNGRWISSNQLFDLLDFANSLIAST